MKIVLLLLMTVGFNCSKEKKICWECELVTSSPSGGSTFVDICNDSDTPPKKYEDGNGNSWDNMACKKK